MALKTKTSTTSRAKNRMLGAFVALAFILVVVVLMGIATSESRKQISVVRLKDNISANAMITEDMLEEYKMYYKELKNYGVQELSDGSKRQSIVTWDKRGDIVGKRYAAYYMRGGTVLFWDATVKEQNKKNSYLYSMDGELLNIQMDTSDFGDMVVPGDVVNVRASYEITDYTLTPEEEYKLNISASSNARTALGTTVKKNELLFSEVSILDMLNGDGASIFDIYYDYISKSKAEQTELLSNSDFLSSVKPETILLEVTAEEADRFMMMEEYGAEYLMTLLPRTGGSAILDSLSDIQEALAGTANNNDSQSK